MSLPDPDQNLTETLQTWKVCPAREPEFRTQVWRRIAARQREASWSGYLRAHAPLAAGAVAVAVVLGGWTGHAQAREQAKSQREAMVKAYVLSLDARAMADEP